MRHALCLFLLCFGLSALSAEFAVLKAKDDADASLAVAVPEWPTKQQPIATGAPVSAPWVRMTQAEVDALKSTNLTAKNSYEAGKPDDTATAQRKSDIAALKAFMQSVNGSATNAQRDAVIKAFIRLVVAEAAN